MFEKFPYTNLHELNLDWIIKITQDFLEQYTSIQQVISDGEDALNEIITNGDTSLHEIIATGENSIAQLTATKIQELNAEKDRLEALLQAWYNTHSQDIANQLTTALADMTTHYNGLVADLNTLNSQIQAAIQQKGIDTLATIPSDYTALYNDVVNLKSALDFPYFCTTPINSVEDSFTLGSGTGASFDKTTRKLTQPVGAELKNSSILTIYFNKRFITNGNNYHFALIIDTNLYGTYNVSVAGCTEVSRNIVSISDTRKLYEFVVTVNTTEYWLVRFAFSSGTYQVEKYLQILKSYVFSDDVNNAVIYAALNLPDAEDDIDRIENDLSDLTDDVEYEKNVTENYPYFDTIPIFSVEDSFSKGSGAGGSYNKNTRTLSLPAGESLQSSYLYVYFDKTFLEVGKTYNLALIVDSDIYNTVNMYLRPDSRISQTSKNVVQIDDTKYFVQFKFTVTQALTGLWYILIAFSSGTYQADKYFTIVESCFFSDEVNQQLLRLLKTQVQETILEVGVGKTYTSLRTALEYANTIASETNHVVIQFYGNGTAYNVRNDITNDDLANSSFIGLIVPDYVKIKGMGGDYSKNIISLELETTIDTETRRRISTLNTYQASELENLTIIGKNTRYAVHDDYANAINVERTMRNLRVIAIDTVNSRSWGAGYRSGCTWNFDNCIFENQGDDSSYSFSAHNSPGPNCKDPASLNFFNCRFITPVSESDPSYDRGVAFGSLNNNANGVINYLNFYGCDIERIVLYEESAASYGAGILTRLRGYGNSIHGQVGTYDGNTIRIYRSDGVDYSSYISML